MTLPQKILTGALVAVSCLALYEALVIGRQRAALREADERLDIVYRERDELTQALAKAQKETREMDSTLAKVQRVLDGMSRRAAERDAALLTAKKEAPPPEPVPVPVVPQYSLPKHTPSAPGAGAPQPPAPEPAKAEVDPAAEAAASQLSIALLQAAVDFAKANPGQKPTDPMQLIPYLPPEMAAKLKQLMQEPEPGVVNRPDRE